MYDHRIPINVVILVHNSQHNKSYFCPDDKSVFSSSAHTTNVLRLLMNSNELNTEKKFSHLIVFAQRFALR